MSNKLKYVIAFSTIAITSYIIYLAFSFGLPQNVTLEQAITMDKLSFWEGLAHGHVVVFSFLMSLFQDDVTIYALYNNGSEYNAGFAIGIILIAFLTQLNQRLSRVS